MIGTWDGFVGKYERRIRPIVLKEVDKFRRYGQKEAGFTLFACLVCSRIVEYDGEKVTFKYFDKTEKKEKQETIRVEEFIIRIIRHLPDE